MKKWIVCGGPIIAFMILSLYLAFFLPPENRESQEDDGQVNVLIMTPPPRVEINPPIHQQEYPQSNILATE